MYICFYIGQSANWNGKYIKYTEKSLPQKNCNEFFDESTFCVYEVMLEILYILRHNRKLLRKCNFKNFWLKLNPRPW